MPYPFSSHDDGVVTETQGGSSTRPGICPLTSHSLHAVRGQDASSGDALQPCIVNVYLYQRLVSWTLWFVSKLI